jgi:hypothetical protein
MVGISVQLLICLMLAEACSWCTEAGGALLLWHGSSVFPVIFERPPHSDAFYDTQGVWRIYSNPGVEKLDVWNTERNLRRDRGIDYVRFYIPLKNFSLIYGGVTIAGEGLQNLGLCSALRVLEQGGIFIVPHLL